MAPRENENKAYAKFGGDKQRTLWYAMVFSGVVNCGFTGLHIMASVCVCVSGVCGKISLLQLGALNSVKNDE